MDVDASTADEVQSTKRSARNYSLGVGLLLIVVFLWTTSSFITQVRGIILFSPLLHADILYQDLYEGGYEKPFLCVPSTCQYNILSSIQR